MSFQEALSLLEAGDVYAYLEWQLMPYVSVRGSMFPVALSAQGLSKLLTSTPLGKPGRPKFSPCKDDTHNISFRLLKHHTHQEQ